MRLLYRKEVPDKRDEHFLKIKAQNRRLTETPSNRQWQEHTLYGGLSDVTTLQ